MSKTDLGTSAHIAGFVLVQRHGSSGTQTNEHAERRLLRRVDRHLLPIIYCLAVVAFLNGTNIGHARIEGMERELKMHGQDYNLALVAFFIPYILFDVPANLLMRASPPALYLGGLMFVMEKYC